MLLQAVRNRGAGGIAYSGQLKCGSGIVARQKMAKGGHVLWCAGYAIKRPFMCMVSHVVNMLDGL